MKDPHKKEGRGRTEKLVYFFPTEKNLEVFTPSGVWARVTCRTFRSWTGPRRIDKIKYEGPIFYENTNYLYEGPSTGLTVVLEGSAEGLRKVRKNSKFAFANESKQETPFQ